MLRQKRTHRGGSKRSTRSTRQHTLSAQTPANRIFWCIAGVFLIAIFYLLFFSGILAITKVEVVSKNQELQETVRAAVQESLSGSYVGVVQKNNYLFLPAPTVERRLGEQFPVLKNVEIQKEFPSSITLFLTERQAVFALCPLGRDTCFFSDGNGIVFRETPASVQNRPQGIFTVYDQNDRHPDLLDEGLRPEMVEYLREVYSEFIGVFGDGELESFVLPHNTPGEVHIRTTQGWSAYVATDIIPSRAVRFVRIAYTESSKEDPNKTLEYVDARFDDKVYYSFDGDDESDKAESDEEDEKDEEESDDDKDDSDDDDTDE